jgi:hypothetical protein
MDHPQNSGSDSSHASPATEPTVTLTVPLQELTVFVDELSREWMTYNARTFFSRLVEAAKHANLESTDDAERLVAPPEP